MCADWLADRERAFLEGTKAFRERQAQRDHDPVGRPPPEPPAVPRTSGPVVSGEELARRLPRKPHLEQPLAPDAEQAGPEPERTWPLPGSAGAGGFSIGDAVRVTALSKYPQLNGLTGSVVGQCGDRWQVQLDDKLLGVKLLRSHNLLRLEASTRSSSVESIRAERATDWQDGRERPAEILRHCIVGTWTDWAPEDMSWDVHRQCFHMTVQLGSSGMESFQIWLEGDPQRCLHPSEAHGVDPLHCRKTLCGPDSNGYDKNWIIGWDPRDRGAPGVPYEVRLFLKDGHFPERVDWVRVGWHGLSPEPQLSCAAPQQVLPHSLKDFLRMVCQSWSEEELDSSVAGLLRIKIDAVPELLMALRSRGSAGLSTRLQQVGVSCFSISILESLREYADLLDRETDFRSLDTSEATVPSTSDAAQAQVLPSQKFEVLDDIVNVHERPAFTARLLGNMVRGEVLTAVRESFDGWVKLDATAGWVLRSMSGQAGMRSSLSPVGVAPLLVYPEVADRPGPQHFEVVHVPYVNVHAAPSTSSRIHCRRSAGDEVVAEAQTYNGWLKLADRGGWVLGRDATQTLLLRCHSLEECAARRGQLEAALAEMDAAAAAGDTERLRSATEQARRAGAAAEALAAAEARAAAARARLVTDERALERALRRAFNVRDQEMDARETQEAALLRQQEERRELCRRVDAAAEDEEELLRCAGACTAAGFVDEARRAELLRRRLLEKRGSGSDEHAMLLERLAAAIKLGDPGAIRSARDAAKSGHVPKKAIARLFALHSV